MPTNKAHKNKNWITQHPRRRHTRASQQRSYRDISDESSCERRPNREVSGDHYSQKHESEGVDSVNKHMTKLNPKVSHGSNSRAGSPNTNPPSLRSLSEDEESTPRQNMKELRADTTRNEETTRCRSQSRSPVLVREYLPSRHLSEMSYYEDMENDGNNLRKLNGEIGEYVKRYTTEEQKKYILPKTKKMMKKLETLLLKLASMERGNAELRSTIT